MRTSTLSAIMLIGALSGQPALGASLDAPDPVHGVTFDEWTAGNARISNGEAEAAILKTLGVTDAQWKDVGERFIEAMRAEGPGSGLTDRYGEIFADPVVGRFRGEGGTPEVKAKLTTFEDYARVQAHLSVGVEAGVDPQAVLKEHGLSVWEFSQESGNWLRQATEEAEKGDFTEVMRRQNAVRGRFEAEYRRRYWLKKKPPED